MRVRRGEEAPVEAMSDKRDVCLTKTRLCVVAGQYPLASYMKMGDRALLKMAYYRSWEWAALGWALRVARESTARQGRVAGYQKVHTQWACLWNLRVPPCC